MNSLRKSINLKVVFKLIILFISLLFFGCTQNLPEITEVRSAVIFSYGDYESLPNARLSIFVQSESDARRCERISIKSLESGYVWETDKLKVISADGISWAGNANLVVPEYDKIPTGMYEITYVNADGEQDKTYTQVLYNSASYDTKGNDVSPLISNNGVLNIAIYDNNNILLYFNEKTEELQTDNDILMQYNSAVSYQDIWISNDNSEVYMLPLKNLK